MIVGTAGHIDHGKTALITALTGINADRLKDEKQRGITIALGFAYTTLANEKILGFIDVPGHENLVHTMVSGASGIDYAMLVIAADDGIMPQTHEHLSILSLLGLKKGCVVITKQDRATDLQLQQLLDELPSFLANSFLCDAPQFIVDSISGKGITELKNHLEHYASEQAMVDDHQLFRLAIDRVFTLEGQGTVVTGTVHSGQAHVEQQPLLHIMPIAKPVRLRAIHAQNVPSQSASVGQRCALNLTGVAKSEIRRGQWIADPLCFVPSHRLDVKVELSAQADTSLKTWSVVHLHIGASHYVAHVVPLSQDQILAGQSALVQLVVNESICAMPGDAFILRNAQAKQTIGGGVVLDPNAPDRKRRSLHRLAWLESIERFLEYGELEALLYQSPYGLRSDFLHRLSGLADLAMLSIPTTAKWISNGRSNHSTLIHKNAWEQILSKIETVLLDFHERYADEPGVEAARLRRMVAPRSDELIWQAALTELITREKIGLNGPWYHLSAHTVSFTEQEEHIAEQMMLLSLAGRYDPPWVRDMAATLEVAEAEIRTIGRKLVRQGRLFQVVRDLYYHRDCVLELAERIALFNERGQGVKAAEFRDSLQLGRKRTIQILEFFERIGYTRRLRDKHLLRPDNTVFTKDLL